MSLNYVNLYKTLGVLINKDEDAGQHFYCMWQRLH